MKIIITDKFIIRHKTSGDKISTEPDFYVEVSHKSLPFDINIRMPYNPLYDTSVTSETHLFRFFYNSEDIKTGRKYHDAIIGQFIKKTDSEVSDYNTIPRSNSGQKIDGTAPTPKTKTIRSQDGETIFSLDNNAVYMKSGDSGLVVGNSGTTIYGGLSVVDMPSESRFVVKESGLMRLLPKAFVPPLSLPDYFPDLTIIGNIYNTIKTVTNIVDTLKKLEGL